MAGLLTLGSVHIGNISDISFRTIRSIIDHDVIAVESLEKFNKLLLDLEIETNAHVIEIPSCEEINAINNIVQILLNDKNVLILSDQGNAGFHDPGSGYANVALMHNIKVTAIPGPNSVITALTVSGMAHGVFIYGCYPKDSDENKEFLKKFIDTDYPIVFLCVPSIIGQVLNDTLEVFGESKHCIYAQDLTMPTETIFRCTVKEMLTKYYNNELNRESVIIIGRPT
jgi:16S rRNA (cytidine1402-2'-O)-methyltransferase